MFNGKFYSSRLNGVHRVADRLIREVDAILGRTPVDERPAARLYIPKTRAWSPAVSNIDVVEDQRARSALWEQMTLPRLAADGVLINLCNLAPLMHRRKIMLVHDAQFLFTDNAFSSRQRLGYKYLVPLAARRSQALLTVSEYSRRILALADVGDYDRMSVLHNSADHMLEVAPNADILSQHALVARQFVIVFGSSKSYKNVEIIFRAFGDSRLASQRLVVVGEGEASLRAKGLSPPADAIFVGSIEDARLRALYEHATCLVFPSRTEGFGLPPLEAMLLGCPAIVAPAGAIPEVCHDAALYAAIDDVEEWVTAILSIVIDRPLRDAKIAAGRRRAAMFSWASAGRRLLELAIELGGRPAERGRSTVSPPSPIAIQH